MRNRDILERYRVIVNIILVVSNFLPMKLHKLVYNLIKPFDGKIMIFLRYLILKKCCQSCGDNVAIFSNVTIYNMEKLEIGSNVSVHEMCYINASGGIEIKNDVSIAHHVSILSEEHNYLDEKINIKDQGLTFSKTKIASNVWIGAGVKILAGSKIEQGSIVAAGAVLKGHVDKNTIVGGVPAKKIKGRVK